METKTTQRISIAWLMLFFSVILSAQNITSVRGQVVDEKTKETMPYVNVQFDGTSIGATSDIDGNFYIETKTSVSKLKISYVGYKTQILKIKQGEPNNLSVKMEEGSTNLQEVVVKVEKYRNKGNPAVELVRRCKNWNELL